MKKLIKRYTNRKLYDTDTAEYITLSNILDRVKSGQTFRVVDVSEQAHRDITNETILRAIVEHSVKESPDSWVPVLVSAVRSQINRNQL